MNKQEFLEKLERGIADLPREDAAERLTFYSEMIDDRMEEGLSEEDAVAGIGSPGAIALLILAETRSGEQEPGEGPPRPEGEERSSDGNGTAPEAARGRRGMRAGEILLLVLGFPLWFPLLIAAFAVVLSLFIVLWCVPLAFWAAFIGCAVGAAGSLFGLVLLLFHGTVTARLAALAAALVLTGVSILLFFVCRGVTRGTFFLTKKTGTGILSLFAGKER